MLLLLFFYYLAVSLVNGSLQQLVQMEIDTTTSLLQLYHQKKQLLQQTRNLPAKPEPSRASSELENALIHRWTSAVDPSIVDVQLLSMAISTGSARRRRKLTEVRHFNLLVFVSVDGSIKGINPYTGETMVTHETHHSHPVVAMQVQDDKIPVVVLRRSNGDLQVLSIEIWKDKEFIVGEIGPRPKTKRVKQCIRKDPMDIRFIPRRYQGSVSILRPWYHQDQQITYEPSRKGYHIHLETDMIIKDHDATVGLVPHLLVHVVRRRKYIFLGDETGQLRIFSTYNSTCIRSYQFSHPIRALAQVTTSVIGFTAGHAVGLLNSNSFTLASECSGGISPIVSLATDALRGGIFYAGTERGDVLVFSIFKSSQHRRQSYLSSYCTIRHRMSSHQAPVRDFLNNASNHAFVAPSKGYVVFSSINSRLVMYNASELLNGRLPYLAELVPFVQKGETLKLMASQKASEEAVIMHKYRLASGEVFVSTYESLYTYEQHIFDVSWIRGPIMIVGLMVVFGWRTIKGSSKSSDPDLSQFVDKFNRWDKSRGGTGLPRGTMEQILNKNGIKQ